MTGLSALAVVSLGGCSTIAGVGKDISAVGGGVTHVANEVREEVFGPGVRTSQTRYTSNSTSQPTVLVSKPCDPEAELAGGTGLPPCPAKTKVSHKAPRYLRRR